MEDRRDCLPLRLLFNPLNTEHSFRIVVYKDEMLNAVVPKSAKPFNFYEAYKLSEEKVRASRTVRCETKLDTLLTLFLVLVAA